jgi:deoxyhypusine synthase
VYRDMVKFGMIDAVVATGASIVDMDFFEALGFKHYQAAGEVDDNVLRDNYIDRIYDTYIDEEELQNCDHTILEICNRLEPRAYSSREFIWEMGKWLSEGNAKKEGSLIQTAYEEGVPIFCPAFVDSSAGFGLVKHQKERIAASPACSWSAAAYPRISPRTRSSAPKSSASRPRCTAMRSRSRSPTCATAPVRPRP